MDKDITPAISVVMPVYNAASFLHDAISSILVQTFSNFELLIFDDASTDGSVSIVNSFHDERIKLFTSEVNKGYVIHLNEGLRLAKGKYIARMDADNISEKDRFSEQINFMEQHPEIGICGAQVRTIDENNNILSFGKHYLSHEELKVKLLIDSCFAHPVVMIRKSVLIDNQLLYNPLLAPAEDYALWDELSLVTKMANLPKMLLRYRVHGQQITQNRRDQQKKAVSITRRLTIERFIGNRIDDHDFKFHNSLIGGEYVLSKEYVEKAKSWLRFLIEENKRKNSYYNEHLFNKEVARAWFTLCTHLYRLGPWVFLNYFSLKLDRSSIPKRLLLRFLVKSWLNAFLSPFRK